MLWLTLTGVVAGQNASTNPSVSQPAQQTLLDHATAALEYARTNQAFIKDELDLGEAALKEAQADLARKRGLFAQGLIPRLEVEKAEGGARDAEALVNALHQQLEAARQMVGRAEQEVELAKNRDAKKFNSPVTLASKHYGRGSWSQDDFNALMQAFRQRFGQPLPISALGQTSTHTRLGYNHYQRMDAAVHPDSPEGQWMMEYLQVRGVPFIAFRSRVPGCATGAHIHVGLPSPRL